MILQLDAISKAFGATTILHQVSLKIEERERMGLVGVNGAGKSTLLNIIVGDLLPDEGQVTRGKAARLGYLRQAEVLQASVLQRASLDARRTVRDEAYSPFQPLVDMRLEMQRLETLLEQGAATLSDQDYEREMNRYLTLGEQFEAQGGHDMDGRVATVLAGMGLGEAPPDLEVGSLSGGQKTRLALARLLLDEPDLLVLDEPTNHLDFATLSWLEGYLANYPGAILAVSHDRYFLDHLVTTVCELERTELTRYTGNYSRFVAQKAAARELQARDYARQQAELARGEDWIARHQARATSARAAKNRRKALDRIELIERPAARLKQARFSFRAGDPSFRDVLQVSGVEVSVGAGQARKRLLGGVDLQLLRGDKVGLIGANGVGKSTLLKTLMGWHEPDAGRINWGERVRIGYYDQEHCELDPDLTVLEQLRHWFPKTPEERLRSVLGGFLISGEEVTKPTLALSGGERARVTLARLMLQEPNVLILDEPTNHLDLASKETLEAALQGYDGTILFVSHSRYFLNRLARRILELTPGGARAYEGNFEAYVARKAAEVLEAAAAAADDPDRSERVEYTSERRSQREEETRQRRFAELEVRIEQLEAGLRLIEQSMAQEAVARDPEALAERHRVAEHRRHEIAAHYAEWERLAASAPPAPGSPPDAQTGS